TIDPIRAAAAGYAVAIQDVRGRWASEGGPFFLYRNEFADGFDTVAWAAGLPYGDGKVGAYGVSYMGATSWQTATTAPPALGAIAPTTAPNDFWEDHIWRDGALLLGTLAMWSTQAIGPSALLRSKTPDLVPALLRLVDDIDGFDERMWHLPLSTFPPARPDRPGFLDFFFEVLRHPARDDFNRSLLVADRHGSVRVPALIIAGWHDLLLAADLEHYRRMRTEAATDEARERTRIVIGPWSHGSFLNVVGERDFGFRASGFFMDLREDLTSLHLRWFDRWLKGKRNGVDEEPPVRLFVQGIDRWRDEHEWPLARARPTPLYLGSTGRLGFAPPATTDPPDSYVYDPHQPCPTRGGTLLMPRTYPAGPVDQAPILSRRDVLAYRSEPLTADVEVTGPVTCVLWAATTGRDTDWMVKLCDVHPDGRTLNVCDGVLRARYSRSTETPELLPAGQPHRLEIRLWATSMVFRAGHRFCVLVTSSDFPRYDRNLNSGELGIDSDRMVAALQTVFHDAERPSHILLPIVP
ncbi:MAG: uncharacterized protein QOD06_889, partial [Candidatus Binatota bacterium]|nr:uncharacterized protein [Candidatus Binatota bacterium]